MGSSRSAGMRPDIFLQALVGKEDHEIDRIEERSKIRCGLGIRSNCFLKNEAFSYSKCYFILLMASGSV